MGRNPAFTLVELLVVITIIVILLALLTPALDRAIYQAELLQCAAGSMKAGTTGLAQYAFNNKRQYPTRGPSGGHIPDHVKTPGSQNVIGDLKDYVGTGSFYDPFTSGVDLSEEANHADTTILANQNWYNDWSRPSWHSSIRGVLKKMGDRLSFVPYYEWGKPADQQRVAHSSVLISDLDVVYATTPYSIVGHPDPNGAVPDEKFQNEGYVRRVIPISKVTLHWFIGPAHRGPLDLNYAYQDGSVERLTQVEFNDDRVDHIIASIDSIDQPRHQQLPRQ